MLPKLYRLKSEKDFARLAKSKRSAYGKVLGVKVRENALPHSRFGIVIGLKVSKKAVRRNLLRRRLREILRKRLPELKPGLDVMVLVRKEALEADLPRLEEDIDRCFRKAGLIA